MPLLRELGAAVQQRRTEIGLSQKQLAGLVELSRATVNQLEGGKLKDLSSQRIERVANELGFAVGVIGTRRDKGSTPLATAVRVASVPYARELPQSVLRDCLREGTIAPAYIAHLRTLLDEAPVAILADVSGQLESEGVAPARKTWERMRALAAALGCSRALWQAAST